MKSYNKNEDKDFEKVWSEAMEHAEASPNPNVWENINNELLHADHARIRGYYKTYKLIAAASVSLLFLAGTAFTYYYFTGTEQRTTLTQNQPSNNTKESILDIETDIQPKTDIIVKSPLKKEIAKDVESNFNNSQSIVSKKEVEKQKLPNQNIFDQSKNNKLQEYSNSQNEVSTRTKQGTDKAFLTINSLKITKRDIIILATNSVNLPPTVLQKEEAFKNAFVKKPIVLANETEEAKVVKRDKSKKFYADVNVLTDYFNPNIELNSQQVSQVVVEQIPSVTGELNTQLLGEENAPAISFSYGINMGVKLSGKWIVESGISYANYNTQSLSNLTISNAYNGTVVPVTILNRPLIDNETYDASLVDLGNLYSINNSFEFASIPVRAGYIVGLKKVNLILKAGVNTGLFLRNEISSNDDTLEPFVNKPEDDESPFRKVHLNGLVSNEINYALNQNYSFSVAANYRFALNSLTKEGENINSMPDSYGIGMVFRYHFN